MTGYAGNTDYAGHTDDAGHTGHADDLGRAGNAGHTGNTDDADDAGRAGHANYAGHAGHADDAGNAGNTGNADNAGNTDDAGYAGHAAMLDAVFRDPVLGPMLRRVEEMLRPVDRLAKSGASFPFRSRYQHSVRVLGWALRLRAASEPRRGRDGAPQGGRGPDGLPRLPQLPHSLAAAAIFHDAGYAAIAGGRQAAAQCHAKFSEEMFVEYASENGLYKGRDGRRQLEEIAGIIAVHSDKGLPNDVLTADQQILMDADLLDEAGAMRFAWICFCEAERSEYGYASAYARMSARLAAAEKEFARLHTDAGRAAGSEMLAYLRAFADGFRSELQLRPSANPR